GSVEENAEGAARPGHEVVRRVRGEVVAPARTAPEAGGRRLVELPTGAAGRRRQSLEDPRVADHLGLLRRIERDADDVDPVIRRVRVLFRRPGRAFRHLGRITYGGGATHVNVDHTIILRMRDDRVRVGAATGLDVLDQSRIARVAHVEDTDAQHAVLAVLYALSATVLPRPPRLGGDEEQVAVDRRV